MTHPDRRVDALREQLRSLGYLDARLDRFVLGGSRRARPGALALDASTRIGLLVGALLGPSAAIGLGWRAPGLVTGPADAAVLALYLGVVFGLAAGLVAAAAVWAGVAVARRRARRPDFSRQARRAATMAGLVVGFGCLAYLTLWWRTALVVAGVASLPSSALTVGVAVVISLLLGHAVTVTVLAVVAGLGLGSGLRPGLPLSSRRSLALLGGVALAGALGLLVASAPGRSESRPLPLTVVPTGERVLVIAIDGMDLATVERLRAAGGLPVIGALMSEGTATVRSDPDRDPARVWTTIATGQPPERHGIRTLESRQVTGLAGRFRPGTGAWSAIVAATDLVRLTRPALASGAERRLPAFWEVAATTGLRTAVVHWWATWPAPEEFGMVLSDRALLRLERGGDLDGEIAPPDLYATLRADWPDRRARAAAEATRAVPDEAGEEIAGLIRRSAELDATLIDLASDKSLAGLDLSVLYLPGLDIAQFALLGGEDMGAMAPSVVFSRLASLERYYAFLDDGLGRLLAVWPPAGRTVVLVAEPGRVRGPADGLLAVSGRPAGHAGGVAPETAVAPTVLYLLGVPLAADFASPPALDLLDPVFVAAHAPRTVDTYGAWFRGPRRSGGRPLDREMIERMRSLGYLR